MQKRDDESREEWLKRIHLTEAKRLWKESLELIERMEKLDFSRVKTDNSKNLKLFTELKKKKFDVLLQKQKAAHRYGSSPAIDCLRDELEPLKVNETELKVLMNIMVFKNQELAKSMDKRLIEFDEECREGESLPPGFVVTQGVVNHEDKDRQREEQRRAARERTQSPREQRPQSPKRHRSEKSD